MLTFDYKYLYHIYDINDFTNYEEFQSELIKKIEVNNKEIATKIIDQKLNIEDGLCDINSFLQVYKKVIEEYGGNELIFSRGEPMDYYPTNCTPNIFRGSRKLLSNGKEAILFDRLVSNKYLKSGTSNLHTAIEAQHGGLGTRLLDVTENILVGLFFALVIDNECKVADKSNGYVYLYKTKKIIENNDSNLVDHFNKLSAGMISFASMKKKYKNAFFIGGNIQNKRIQRQQGSFILFYSDDKNVINKFNKKHLIGRIKINKNAKENMLIELENYFGINKHYVYPELNNSTEKLVKEVEEYYEKFL